MTQASTSRAAAPVGKLISLLGSTAILALSSAGAAYAQTGGSTVSGVVVTAERAVQSYQPPAQAALGPLGDEVLANTPQTVTVVPGDLILNLQSKTVNDTLRYLPSVQVRDQQGYEVSRPQARGFQGSVAQNTRIDGLSIVGTSATAAEMLDSVEVMNGLSGALYGPATPAGVFNYQLKRPTNRPMAQFTESYDSTSVFTEHLDAGGRFGPDDRFGLRLNAVRGDGQSWASDSYEHRTLAGVAFDYHVDPKTVVELNYVYYDTNITGLPGSIVYDGVSSKSGTSSFLPIGLDPTKTGYGQSGAGADLTTNLGSFKVKTKLSDQWSFEFGGLYQDAIRNLFGITNTLNNDAGVYTVTKNFTAVPHFTIGSNEGLSERPCDAGRTAERHHHRDQRLHQRPIQLPQLDPDHPGNEQAERSDHPARQARAGHRRPVRSRGAQQPDPGDRRHPPSDFAVGDPGRGQRLLLQLQELEQQGTW